MNMKFYMEEALREAQKALHKKEIPVGAVIVKDGQIISRAHNLKETLNDPTAHAEIIAIREASRVLANWRLEGCNLYVTLEPCPMCAGAINQARIDRLIYGAMDLKTGACGSLFNLTGDLRLNHKVEVVAGIMEEECKLLLKTFFEDKRI